MAIVFLQQRKIQRNLIIVFLFVFIVTVIVIWQGFFKKESEVLPGETILLPKEEVKIDFDFFKNAQLQKLLPFAEIQPFEGEIGRDNPFLPY
ncbi:MAG: hypothetical protein PHE52_01440 [Candidatus Pacebacteria bacterium]|nr:hypothetical protein [Candidatus Paceibacterota bacterium]